MPVRHFYLLSHYICNGLLFLFSACWLQKDECNSLWGQLRGRRQMSITTQKVFLSAIFTCSHSTFVMVYYFYFLCFGSRRNEWNSIWGQKVVAYSDTVSAMLLMMIRWYCQLSLYVINAPLYCSNISFFSRDISSEQAVVFWFLPPLPQRLLRSFLLEPKHRKKKYCHIPDAAWERI